MQQDTILKGSKEELSILLTTDGLSIHLINIYAPNSDSSGFLNNMWRFQSYT